MQHHGSTPAGFGDMVGGTRDGNIGFGAGNNGGFLVKLNGDFSLEGTFHDMGGGGATAFSVISSDPVPVGACCTWTHFALT